MPEPCSRSAPPASTASQNMYGDQKAEPGDQSNTERGIDVLLSARIGRDRHAAGRESRRAGQSRPGSTGQRLGGRSLAGAPIAERSLSIWAARSRSTSCRPTAPFWAGRFCPASPCRPARCTSSPTCCPWSRCRNLPSPRPLWEKPPRPVCKSGLYWGAIGGVRELIARLGAEAEKPQIFVTGGAGAAAAGLLTGAGESPAVLVPHLTLAGIALAGPPG